MNFYEDQKEVVVSTFILHKLDVMHTFQKKNGRKTHGITVLFNEY